MEIFSYRPDSCASPSILVVFHGNGRTAEEYRDAAIELADRSCFVIYAPLFDEDRFPNWSYHRGGLVHNGELQDPDIWTVDLMDEILDKIRTTDGRDVPIYLFGHSAGGQFLSRVAAYSLPTEVERIVIANPSTYVLPSLDEDAPYGFGGLPDDFDAVETMKAYLAAPITIYLGKDDTGMNNVTMTEQAKRQGQHRLDRGRQTFSLAQAEAERRGWSFGWRSVEVADVGHSARDMLTANAMLEALGFDAIP